MEWFNLRFLWSLYKTQCVFCGALKADICCHRHRRHKIPLDMYQFHHRLVHSILRSCGYNSSDLQLQSSNFNLVHFNLNAFLYFKLKNVWNFALPVVENAHSWIEIVAMIIHNISNPLTVYIDILNLFQ